MEIIANTCSYSEYVYDLCTESTYVFSVIDLLWPTIRTRLSDVGLAAGSLKSPALHELLLLPSKRSFLPKGSNSTVYSCLKYDWILSVFSR